MASYLEVNDIHMGPAPSSCTDTYGDDLIGLLYQTSSIARERRCAAVTWAGDVFHLKVPSRTSHAMVQQMIEVVRSYPCPVFVVPGNHDMQHDRIESVMLTQPLGVLIRAGLQVLEGWADEHPLYGVPWQQNWDGLDFALENYRYADAPGLVVAHAPLYPPGLELPWENIPAADWAAAMGGQGSCWYGHVHESHGAPYEVGGVTFANFGALSRGSLHEHNLTREVSVGLWESSTGQFERIALNARPAAEVFRLEEHAQVTDMQGRLDAFLEQAGTTKLERLDEASVLAHVKSLNLGSDTDSLVADLLEFARHKESK